MQLELSAAITLNRGTAFFAEGLGVLVMPEQVIVSAKSRVGDVGSIVRLMQPLTGVAQDPAGKRRLFADLCRFIGEHVAGNSPASTATDSAALAVATASQDAEDDSDARLSPRLRQTLQSLLAGASEKQVAMKLGLSQHTVHVYVKALYKRYGVSSRGELLARWVRD
jgi:DNA-binding CsgD family transcriptional regulator